MGKEAIREDRVKRYVHTPLSNNTKATDFVASNLPMVAMFMRNKPIAWSAFFVAFQSYLNEPLIKDPEDDAQPSLLKVLFAFIGLAMSYIDLLFPQVGHPPRKASITAATATAVQATATAVTALTK